MAACSEHPHPSMARLRWAVRILCWQLDDLSSAVRHDRIAKHTKITAQSSQGVVDRRLNAREQACRPRRTIQDDRTAAKDDKLSDKTSNHASVLLEAPNHTLVRVAPDDSNHGAWSWATPQQSIPHFYSMLLHSRRCTHLPHSSSGHPRKKPQPRLTGEVVVRARSVQALSLPSVPCAPLHQCRKPQTRQIPSSPAGQPHARAPSLSEHVRTL